MSGNLFIADQFNNRIRKVNANGIITTVAGDGSQGYSGDGGQATNASLNLPTGLTVNAAGNLCIADSFNSRVRLVRADGVIRTVAGTGAPNYSGDRRPTSAVDVPTTVAFDALGNLWIADFDNNRIRKVDASGLIVTVGRDLLGQRAALGARAVDPDPALRVEERRQKAEPFDVIEMQVREQQVELANALQASLRPRAWTPVPASSTTTAPLAARTSTMSCCRRSARSRALE